MLEMARAPYNSSHFAPAAYLSGEEADEYRLPLFEYMGVLKRFRWRILGFCTMAVAATWIITARMTPIYESITTVDVDRQTPAGVVGQDATRGSAHTNGSGMTDR